MNDEPEELYAGRSFESILRLYSDTVLRACLVHCNSDDDAKDCYQNTFLKLYTCHKQFNDIEHVKAWLLTVAMHECCELYRSKWKRHINLTDDMNSVLLEHEDFMCDAGSGYDYHETVLELVLKMPPIYRQVVYLFYYEEMDIRHIAKMLGISPNTVKTRLQRGRKLLKTNIKEEWGVC
jgi:RNA polymerase sigma-70 factor (ECF subfamily)